VGVVGAGVLQDAAERELRGQKLGSFEGQQQIAKEDMQSIVVVTVQLDIYKCLILRTESGRPTIHTAMPSIFTILRYNYSDKFLFFEERAVSKTLYMCKIYMGRLSSLKKRD
jgi:hypothetical protein